MSILARLASALLLVIRDKTIGVNDRCPVLASADVPAERESLSIGYPILCWEPVFDDSTPEDKYIDPAVRAMRAGIPRQLKRRFGRGRPPWLNPRKTTRFQLGNYLAGDLVVEVRPVGDRMSSIGPDRHRGSPPRAPKASPSAFNPSRKPAPPLTLRRESPCSPDQCEQGRTRRKHRNVRQRE